jgi:hypothetical protein
VHPMCVHVESRAVSFPPLWVMSRVRPVGSLTDTALSDGTADKAMMPFTAAALLGGLDVVPAGAVVDVPVLPVPAFAFEPPELPHAARSATPPAPAPISSWRRGHVKVEGSAAELLDKGNLRKGRGVYHAISRAKQMKLWDGAVNRTSMPIPGMLSIRRWSYDPAGPAWASRC